MAFGDSDTPQLSTSRVNRLLRPLRSRCSSLASFASSPTTRHHNLSTYSTRSGGAVEANCNSPPLLILHPPGSLGTSKYLNRDQAEIARRIYAIRDCFRDIVVNTGRQMMESTPNVKLPTRIMSLAAMCSVLVGDDMECQAGPEENDEDEPSNVVDDLYTTIPLEYRRWALLSHALSLVLNSTVHHLTLLVALIELTLDHKLHHESYTLLNAVISLALRATSPSNVPPICHPAHSNFLLELHTRWNAGCFSETSFFKVFVETLRHVQCHDALTCKATHNLAQVMCSRDFPSFIWLIGIIPGFDVNSGPKTGRRDGYKSPREAVQSRFSTWLKMAFEQFPFPTMPRGSKDVTEHTDAVGQLLLSAFSSGHQRRWSSDAEGFLLCLATCWLVSQSYNRLPSIYLIDRLRGVLPPACTFTPLIEKVLSESNGLLKIFQETMECLSTALRAAGLLQLEASLWACALRHIEHPMYERSLAASNSIVDIQSYRHRLIGLVDDAENSCFGLQVIDLPRVVLSQNYQCCGNVALSHQGPGLSNGTWEWEALVGCWIRKTEDPASVRKKRKIEHAIHRSRTIRRGPQPSLDIRPETPTTIESFRRSSKSNATKTHDGFALFQEAQISYCNEKAYPPLGLASINFPSLVSDAQSKRATLHPDLEMRVHSKAQRSSWIVRQSTSEDRANPNDDGSPKAFLFSDDSLDLFACASSSPVRR